jgi:hypothetical protein
VDAIGEILPVLVALYVIDGVMLVRAGQVLFVSGGGGRFEARGPGLRLPGLLPVAEAVVGASLPLRACADGVFVPGGRRRERLFPFESMGAVSAAGGTVRLASGVELPVRPPGLAPEVARVLERLRTTPRARRLARLRRELRRRSDPRALSSLRARESRMLEPLRWLSGLTFLALFALLPMSLTPVLPRRPSPLAALLVVLVLYGATLGASARLLLDCGVRGKRLLGSLLPLLLFPPAAAHAPSIVVRDLFLGFEPTALARELLPPRALDRFERVSDSVSSPGAAPAAWDLAALVRGLVTRARARGAPLPPPPRTDASAHAFCPRCLAEYRAGFGRCSDCDVALVPFAPDAPDSSRIDPARVVREE